MGGREGGERESHSAFYFFTSNLTMENGLMVDGTDVYVFLGLRFVVDASHDEY